MWHGNGTWSLYLRDSTRRIYPQYLLLVRIEHGFGSVAGKSSGPGPWTRYSSRVRGRFCIIGSGARIPSIPPQRYAGGVSVRS